MTTKVMIYAGHGWPVDAVLKAVGTGEELSTQRIAADQTGTIFLHAGADLFLHEVQPDELGADSYDDEASAAADLADAKARSEATGQPIPDPLIDPVVTIDPATNQITDAPAAPAPTPAATNDGASPLLDPDATGGVKISGDGTSSSQAINTNGPVQTTDQSAADAASAAAAQEAADAQAAADKKAADDAAAAAVTATAEQEAAAAAAQQAQADAQAKADADAAQAKIDADAAQKEIDDKAAADAAAQADVDAAAQKAIDDQAAANAVADAASAAAADAAGATEVVDTATDPASVAPVLVPAPDADVGPAVAPALSPNFGTDPIDEEDPAKVITE